MEGDYEKRLLGSPLTSPAKSFSAFGPAPGLTSPVSSPSKESYGDRYIPVRTAARWKIDFDKPNDIAAKTQAASAAARRSRESANQEGRGADPDTYRLLLRNELAPEQPCEPVALSHSNSSHQQDISSVSSAMLGSQQNTVPGQMPPGAEPRVLMPRENRNMFTYKIRRESPNKLKLGPYSLSPVSDRSQRLLRSPRKQLRRIAKVPYKVLDAPELQDDFYLNLVDWSSQNVLAVGLGTCVYLWSAFTSQVTRLCDLANESDNVSSVAWSEKGAHVAVGTQHGKVQVWDVQASKKLLTMEGHTARVGALAWNSDLLASGSRDRLILLRDSRSASSRLSNSAERRLKEHRQEVCGLRWSPDHQHLASGGNDNKLYVWSLHGVQPVQSYTEHVAAVKAISWSPHQHGLLASGGGTADRCIRFWNTLTGQPLQNVDTGSQVCNIAWSKHTNELVSTHGYSQNQILVWKYPALTQLAKLTGHTYRVLYLAMSPCGESIVTGAGDETLRFWSVFTKARQCKPVHSELNLFGGIR